MNTALQVSAGSIPTDFVFNITQAQVGAVAQISQILHLSNAQLIELPQEYVTVDL